MEAPGKQRILEAPDRLHLQQRIILLERGLRECHEEHRAARVSKEQFETFSQRVMDYAFISFDPENRIVSWSRGAEHIFGYSEAEILGQPGEVIFTPEDRGNGEAENEFAAARRNGCVEDDRWHLRRDGTRFWGSGVLTAHRDSSEKLQGYSKVMRDQTSRKLMEERLHESEERFRLFSENVRDYALIRVDATGNISGWNLGAERTFGYTEEEIVGRPVKLFFTPEDRERGQSEKDLNQALTEGRAEDDRWMIRKDGTRFWACWVTTPMHDASGRLHGFAKVLRDETERKQAEDLLAKSLQEKELLLREVHHRVKNNLHVITSLISLQAGQVNDSKLQVAFEELQDRIRAIAALHETLYSSSDLANINFGPYLQQLLSDLVAFHGIDRQKIQVRTGTDDLVLSTGQALLLGLIANELVSNCLKHAFPGQRRGEIDVRFRYLAETRKDGQTLKTPSCELAVTDDGIGIDNPEGIWQSKSMGLRIVDLLTKQLDGRVALDHTQSTRFTVQFPIKECEYSSPMY